MKIAVVEDSSFDAQKLLSHIEKYKNEEKVDISVSLYEDATSFLIAAGNSKFDIVFMDIEMPGIDGLECAAKWREIDPKSPLIFVTNMAQYAIKGYEVSALDFVVKPIEYFPFKMKLEKAIRLVKKETGGGILKVVGDDKQIIPLKLSDVVYIESDGHFIIFNDGVKEYRMHKSLKEAEAELSQYGFARISGSFLVNLAHVREVRRQEVVVGKVALPLSRSKKKEFMDAFAVYLGERGS